MSKENPRKVTIINPDGSRLEHQVMRSVKNGDKFIIEEVGFEDNIWTATDDGKEGSDGVWGIMAHPTVETEKTLELL